MTLTVTDDGGLISTDSLIVIVFGRQESQSLAIIDTKLYTSKTMQTETTNFYRSRQVFLTFRIIRSILKNLPTADMRFVNFLSVLDAWTRSSKFLRLANIE